MKCREGESADSRSRAIASGRFARRVSRRDAIKLVSLAAAGAAAPAVLRGRYRLFAQGREYSARAVRLVRESTVVDMLCQFAFPDNREEGTPRAVRWLRDPTAFADADVAVFRESGVNVLALGRGGASFEAGLRFCAEWNGFIASHSDWFLRIDDSRDLDVVNGSGKVGIMITTQDATHFRTPDDVEVFWQLGQRICQLTYNFQNRLGAGFLEHRDGGLTVFGHDVLARMEAVRMIADLSHCADQTTMDAIAAAKRPPVFTHASSRALLPGYRRCKTDEAIRALAAKGGVMGIPFIRFLIRPEPPVTVEHVVDHVDHVIRLAGAEHVGIGSDMDMAGLALPIPRPGATPAVSEQANFDRYHAYYADNGGAHVDGLDHHQRVYDLTEALIRRGHSDETIRLVLGANVVRVLKEVWG
jgi:membrane dipeptidase